MADQQTQTPTSQQATEDVNQQDQRDQAQFDSTFLQQISGRQQLGGTVDWAREYFDTIEQQVRSARRVAETAALSDVRQQIVSEAAYLAHQQVMAKLQQQGNRSQR